MKVRIVLRKEERVLEIPDSSTAEIVLKVLGLLPDAHLLLRDSVPIPIDEILREGDSIKIIKVASGG